MQSTSGTYVVIYRCETTNSVVVGRWGQVKLQMGYYLYVGSAFGPGGVKARVSRHCRKNKKLHWHIDYLTAYFTPISVWFNHGDVRLEHQWAGCLATRFDFQSVPRFGSSDCHCASHLFYSASRPDFESFSERAEGIVEMCR
ncbi:MAG: GIY-YIG nuclease family protein [Pseudomonadales bacterium]|nr:GIY-YIG nuclease family protein [Pseudomonadales bacterium]